MVLETARVPVLRSPREAALPNGLGRGQAPLYDSLLFQKHFRETSRSEWSVFQAISPPPPLFGGAGRCVSNVCHLDRPERFPGKSRSRVPVDPTHDSLG